MRKRISFLVIILAMLLIVSGCAAKDKPEATVSEFIDAMKKFDLEAMASKINSEDKETKEEFADLFEDEEGKDDEFMEFFLDYMKSNAKKITYEIKEVEIDEDTATVPVDFKYVNGLPLFRAAFSEYMKQVVPLAFSGQELSDEEMSEMFLEILEEQKETVEEKYTEKTIEFKCVKLEDGWYIDDLDDDLFDVAMSNFMTFAEDIEDSFDFDGDSDESATIMEQAEKDDLVVIEKKVGDQVTLATIELQVNEVEEKETLTPSYGSPISAKEGTKFVLVGLDITNITKSEISMSPDLKLVDNQGREFSSYSDTVSAIDDYMDYRDLSPSIKESGYFLYEVPKDAAEYSLVIGKAETDEIYKIVLK